MIEEEQAEHKKQLKRRMKIMLIGVGILFGLIFLYKAFMSLFLHYILTHDSKVVTVSTMKAKRLPWQPNIKAAASVRAISGVNVTTELAGMIQAIYAVPGAMVTKGTPLVQLNADTEIGQLESLKAQLALAKITYERDKKQYAAQAVSKQTVDSDEQNMKSLQGQVAEQSATVLKKTIRAPFTGKLGLVVVSLGQFINPGDKIAALQSIDPIWVDFYVPQQELVQLEIGQSVRITSDSYPHKTFVGKITTIDSAIDVGTRNVAVEATVANPDGKLRSGMFTLVEVDVGKEIPYLTLPQTAISYNAYGNLVYIVRRTGTDKHGEPTLIASQAFVVTGETRGDQVTILKGLHEGDEVVTSGQLKLKNKTPVKINNAITPTNEITPELADEH